MYCIISACRDRFKICSDPLLMINTQLERCGDIAVNVAQRVKEAGEFHALIEESKIMDMAKEAKGMVKG